MSSQQLYLFLSALLCTAAFAVEVRDWSNGKNSTPAEDFLPQVWNHIGADNIGLIAPAGAPFGRKLILSGGFDGYENKTNVWAFNLFGSDDWILTPESLQDLFASRSHHTATVYKDYLFNFGGAANCSEQIEPIEAQRVAFGDEHVVDDQQLVEIQEGEDPIPTGETYNANVPAARTGHSAVFYNEYLYVFGGYNQFTGKFYDELWRADLRWGNNLKWENLTPRASRDVAPRAGHTAIVYHDNMYVYGGENAHGFLGDILRFDFLTGVWIRHYKFEEKFTFPKARSGHAAVFWSDESMYIWGGFNNKDKFLNDMWKFDLQTEEWSMVFEGEQAGYNPNGFNTPAGRSHFAYSVVDGKLVIIGGQTAKAGVDVKFWSPRTRFVPIFHPEDFAGDVWAFDFCDQQWTFIGCLPPWADMTQVSSPTECQSHHAPVCENDCSGNGVCVRDGHCVCEGEWSGEDCSINICDADKYLGYSVELMDRILITETILKAGKSLLKLKEELVYIKERLPSFEEFTSCVRFHPSVADHAHTFAAPEGKAYNDDLKWSLLPILDEFNQCLDETHDGSPIHA